MFYVSMIVLCTCDAMSCLIITYWHTYTYYIYNIYTLNDKPALHSPAVGQGSCKICVLGLRLHHSTHVQLCNGHVCQSCMLDLSWSYSAPAFEDLAGSLTWFSCWRITETLLGAWPYGIHLWKIWYCIHVTRLFARLGVRFVETQLHRGFPAIHLQSPITKVRQMHNAKIRNN